MTEMQQLAKLGPMKEKGLRIKGENAVFARAKAESREGNGTYDVFGSFEFARCFDAIDFYIWKIVGIRC